MRQTRPILPETESAPSPVPGSYNHNGLRFAYPDNWVVEDDEQGTADAAATANSPQTAFWSVMMYRGERDLEPLTRTVLEALQSEYPQMEVDPAGDVDHMGFDVSFSYVDLLNTASIRAFHRDGDTYLVLSQAEDHELAKVEPVFAAMTASLNREL